jgi:hypothetical protein
MLLVKPKRTCRLFQKRLLGLTLRPFSSTHSTTLRLEILSRRWVTLMSLIAQVP